MNFDYQKTIKYTILQISPNIHIMHPEHFENTHTYTQKYTQTKVIFHGEHSFNSITLWCDIHTRAQLDARLSESRNRISREIFLGKFKGAPCCLLIRATVIVCRRVARCARTNEARGVFNGRENYLFGN